MTQSWSKRRAYSISQLKVAFPNDAEAIDALAEMHPNELPRLEPFTAYDAEGQTEAQFVLASLVSPLGEKWKIVWS